MASRVSRRETDSRADEAPSTSSGTISNTVASFARSRYCVPTPSAVRVPAKSATGVGVTTSPGRRGSVPRFTVIAGSSARRPTTATFSPGLASAARTRVPVVALPGSSPSAGEVHTSPGRGKRGMPGGAGALAALPGSAATSTTVTGSPSMNVVPTACMATARESSVLAGVRQSVCARRAPKPRLAPTHRNNSIVQSAEAARESPTPRLPCRPPPRSSRQVRVHVVRSRVLIVRLRHPRRPGPSPLRLRRRACPSRVRSARRAPPPYGRTSGRPTRRG